MKMQIVKIPFVTESEKRAMYALHRDYFSNDSVETFVRDMGEKDWIIVLRDDETIFGFSTIQVIEGIVDGRDTVFVFTGDTIVDRQYWQSNMLAPAFGFFMLRMIEDYEGHSIYWYLISKGYRTYRFLPVYFRKYYPVYNEATPERYHRLLRFIGSKKWGDSYDPETGIVSFNGKKDHLNEGMCRVPESKKKNPHIRFFLERNPYYYRGDELACIAEISRENLNELAYRIMENKSVQWVE